MDDDHEQPSQCRSRGKPVPLEYANGDEADVETWTRRATWSSLLEEFAALKRRVAKLEGRKFNPLPRRKRRED